MKAPRKFFEPLAIGAPRPYFELPAAARAHDPFRSAAQRKVRAKVGELAAQVDVVLGNLEDAIPMRPRRTRVKVSSRWHRRMILARRGSGFASTR